MADQVQHRRGTRAENDVFTGAEGEFLFITDEDRVTLHNGSDQGGVTVPNAYDLQTNAFNYGAAGGTANAITVSTEIDAVALVSGLRVLVKIGTTNTSAATLKWGDTTLKNIKKYAGTSKVDVEADDLPIGRIIAFDYDGTDWVANLGGGSSGESETQEFSSNSTLNFPSVFEAGFNYEIELSAISMNTAGTHALIRFTDDNGTTYESSSYSHQYTAVNGGTSVAEAGSTAYAEQQGASLPYATSNFGGQNINQKMTVFLPASTGQRTGYVYQSAYNAASGLVSVNGAGQFTGDQALTGFQVVTTSGVVSSGTVTLRHLPTT